MTITLTPDLAAGLARAAQTRQFASADDYALRLLTDAATQGCAELKAEQSAKRLAVLDAKPEIAAAVDAEVKKADDATVEADATAGPGVEKEIK